jgi:hypothetical protein
LEIGFLGEEVVSNQKNVLNEACRVGILKMILLQFEMFEFSGTCYFKYCHMVKLGFG